MKKGNKYTTKSYGVLTVVDFISTEIVIVKFDDTGYITRSTKRAIIAGSVRDKMMPISFGVGFIGDGKHKSREDGKRTKAYEAWYHMLERCYSESYLSKYPTYEDCSVCDEWHNFQVFAKWYYENYPNNCAKWHLDKDTKVPGNKIYSPHYCVFISAESNVAEARCKHYKFIDPNGNAVEIKNLSKFCRERNLHQGCMSAVSLGKNKSHKGWTKA